MGKKKRRDTKVERETTGGEKREKKRNCEEIKRKKRQAWKTRDGSMERTAGERRRNQAE